MKLSPHFGRQVSAPLFAGIPHPCRCGCGRQPHPGRDYYWGHRLRARTNICKDCGLVKPLSEFYKGKSRNYQNRYWRCKDCVSQKHKKSRSNWTDEQRRANQRNQLRWRLKKLGISLEEYEGILAKQKMACAICRQGFSKKLPCVDHCHKTGMVRGLLCENCNWGLGSFKDDTNRLTMAIEYLKTHDA